VARDRADLGGGLAAGALRVAGKITLGIAICAVLATASAFAIQLWAQQFTSSSHAAILFTLEPVFASATSYILLCERLGSRAMFGAVFVLAGF
jgi:drug/metabolite transporter (DMT)-like permease